MIPLFEMYPQLSRNLPYTPLSDLPTPVSRLEKLAAQTGVDELYIKQDGLTAAPFGGNKVRKLEFLLGEALERGAKEVLTFGYAGSNHALACAVHSRRLGLKSISMLMQQQNAHYVRRNLLMSLRQEAEFHVYPNKNALLRGATYQKFRHLLKTLKTPVVIPPGGTSCLGVCGYVNAALELKLQIEKKELPEPDLIYLPMGTAGTLAGLMIGLKLAGLKSRVVPVRVVDHSFTPANMVTELLKQTVSFLRSVPYSRGGLAVPDLTFSKDEARIRDHYLGEGYTYFTRKGAEAVRLMAQEENILLDGTYTGKGFSALLDDARRGDLKRKRVLYWNTLNAYDFSAHIKEADYHHLPKSLHWYFQQEVQALDQMK